MKRRLQLITMSLLLSSVACSLAANEPAGKGAADEASQEVPAANNNTQGEATAPENPSAENAPSTTPERSTAQPASLPSATAEKKSAAETLFAERLMMIQTLTGEFTQRLVDHEGHELQLTEGQFKVKRPGYFYWEISPPYEQIVIGTPSSLKVYDPDLEQMTVHEQNSLAGTPAALISGDVEKIFEQYTVTVSTAGEQELFTLTQKLQDASAFESLVFTFSRANASAAAPVLLSHMMFRDKLGQQTEISLKNATLNANLNATAFQFVPPEGTDIIVDG